MTLQEAYAIINQDNSAMFVDEAPTTEEREEASKIIAKHGEQETNDARKSPKTTLHNPTEKGHPTMKLMEALQERRFNPDDFFNNSDNEYTPTPEDVELANKVIKGSFFRSHDDLLIDLVNFEARLTDFISFIQFLRSILEGDNDG